MMDLGTLETDDSGAESINEHGQVLGWFEDKGKRSWFIWEPSSGLKIIDLPHPKFSASNLNNNGQFLVAIESESYLYDPHKGLIKLHSLGFLTYPRSLNDKGQVIGCVEKIRRKIERKA
jgi:hypothetical protein